ncbi:GLUG motif-containing protein, partial [Fibrobacter sp.]|uniref:GLUG motif-containing protein n=1 Tax=Fibrobacter sp. TaxID=35828 RepID=UPI00388D4987
MSFATGGDLGGGTYDGSSSKPYQISDAADLKTFASKVNGGETTAYAVLTQDIDMNQGKTVLDGNGDLYNNGEGLETWTPIGTSSAKYNGTFDGNGHTIRGLYFNDENTNYVGLFGYIVESAKVQNVGVVDSYLKGYSMVGGVVGYNNGIVNNVYNTGTVSGYDIVGGVVGFFNGGAVSNVYNTGTVSGTDDVGGVVGYNAGGTVSNVYNTGSVSGDFDVGGVVGYNDNGTVSNVYNTGSVSGYDTVGGVVGYNNGIVNNVYNTGSVSGYDILGGVVGYNDGSIRNVYNTRSVSGDFDVGGVVGKMDGGDINKAYYDKQTCNICNSYGRSEPLTELA